jgi:broad-specificity NMP kinase
MMGLACVSLPALPGHAVSPTTKGEFEVDTAKARRDILRRPPDNVVAYGHLLPYVLPPKLVHRIVVLRCDPMVLRDRLSRRGYSSEKITGNVEAELIGIIASDAMETFGQARTLEFDTTAASPASAAKSIVRLVREGKSTPRRIDWLSSYGSPHKLRSLLSP